MTAALHVPSNARRDRVVVFMPAYCAEKTLRNAYERIPRDHVDEILLVDDHSSDGTERVARSLDLRFHRNERNLGYGGNLKTCIALSLALDADILIELHADDQYDPSAIPQAIAKVQAGHDLVLGSRFATFGSALRDAMPVWKYAINRLSSIPARAVLGTSLTDFHCGFRAYRRLLLESVPYASNADDYLFSFQIIAQACFAGFAVGEVPVACRYFPDATQIGFTRSMRYGAGALRTLASYLRAKNGSADPIFRR